MNEQEALLYETSEKVKAAERRLDSLEEKVHGVENDQKAIYKIATSVELIAQRVSNIEDKVDETNKKVDAQSEAWRETERKLTEKANEIEDAPYRKTAENFDKVKMAVITAICTMLATGFITALIQNVK